MYMRLSYIPYLLTTCCNSVSDSHGLVLTLETYRREEQ